MSALGIALGANFLAFGFTSLGVCGPRAVVGFLKFVMRFGHFSCFCFNKNLFGAKFADWPIPLGHKTSSNSATRKGLLSVRAACSAKLSGAGTTSSFGGRFTLFIRSQPKWLVKNFWIAFKAVLSAEYSSRQHLH